MARYRDLRHPAQAKFVQDEATRAILTLLSNIKEENVKTSQDDGVTQTVTARAGIALVKDVEVPNPVSLRPYRTFMEVEQPQSSFVLRLRSGSGEPSVSLHEADGGKWKLEAIQGIKGFLENEFTEAAIGIPVIA